MKRHEIRVAVTGLRGFPDVQGGIETHCEQLYPRLVTEGCAVTVFARRPYMPAASSRYQGVSLTSIPCPANRFLETVIHTFCSVLRARLFCPDILHIHGIGPSLMTPLARLLGMKVVVTTHGPDYRRAKWGRLAKVFLKLCETVGMASANEVIAIADDIASDLRRKYQRRATVIPNGVVLAAPLTTMGALEEFDLEQKKYILAVGRFVPEKGFHDLLQAFDKAGLAGWKLAVVGRADHEDAYSQRLKEQAAQKANVVLTGFQKGIPLQELYSHAGLFVIPSYFEGLPIVLLEALSYGLPCIASDISANRNVPLPPERFFRPGDIAGLAAAIAHFASHPIDDGEMRAQVAMVQRDYDWDAIAGEVLQVYKKVLAGCPKPSPQGLLCSRNKKH